MKNKRKVDKKRKQIPKKIEAKLIVESRNICNICWKSKEVQIHHIIPIKLGGNNSEDNLIVVCLNCHSEAHTKKEMARNLGPETLRLFKETWTELIRRNPLIPESIVKDENDIKIIREILKFGNRRALYFPFNLEIGYRMFKSLDDFRIYIQSSGYKLINNSFAKEQIQQIYKTLIEIEFLKPTNQDEMFHCLHGALGRTNLPLLALKRKSILFHLNELAKLIGYENGFIYEDEFERLDVDIAISKFSHNIPSCFGNFSIHNPECRECEFIDECKERSI